MNLFAYGTLLVPKIWEAVTGSAPPENLEARLPNYNIFRIRNGDFPGIVETDETGAAVYGRVFFDLSEQTMGALDAYEDTFYERVEVDVITGNAIEKAYVYRIPQPEAVAVLTQSPWTLDWFEREAMERYCARLFS